jgi:hypothetical protein
VREYTEYQVLSVQELFPDAFASAQKWMDDAYLNSVSQFFAPATDTDVIFVSFTFRSHTFPNKYFSYDYTIRGSIETEQWEGEFEISRPSGIEINPETLPFDSLEAFKIMYDELGKDFYQHCQQESWPLVLTLEQWPPTSGNGELTWNISFSCNVPEKMNAIFIDAKSGEVLEIRK